MKNIIIPFLLLLAFPALSQNFPKHLKGRSYEAYFMQNGKDILIDSTSLKDPFHPGLEFIIDFPKQLSDSGLQGKSTIRYYSVSNNDCNFTPQTRVTADSVFFITMNGDMQIYDPCEGHTDWADGVWNMFTGNVSASYSIYQDHLLITWDNGNKKLYLRPVHSRKK
jgi:hypothetical protein